MIPMTQALQGLANAESQFNTAGSNIAQWPQTEASGKTPATDTVDLSTQAVAMLQAQNNFEANTKMIKVADQMDQTLLNAIG